MAAYEQVSNIHDAQLARVAAAHNMTVSDWLAKAARIEQAEKYRRGIDQQMREIPQYQDDAA